jgi:S1-C subfamily serine protease
VPGDVLDLILLALAAAFAVAGYRQGFIIGVLSLAGFVGGVAVGAIIAPPVSRALSANMSWQAFVAILVLFACAVFGMLIASAIGVAVRSRISGRPATFLDSVGGAAVNVVSVLVVAWLIGSLVANASFPGVARQVSDSLVLRAVDRLMPKSVLYLPVFPPLRTLMSNGLYSPVFSALGAEAAVSLPAPSGAALGSPEVVADEQSIVKVQGIAPTCSLKIEGTGFVISPGHVLTNAHVVAGVTEGPTVSSDGRTYQAHVVLYDAQRDIAVLAVPGLQAPPLRLAGPAPFGANAVVVGFPRNAPRLTLTPARVGHSIEASGPNIYQTDTVNRQIYAIRAAVEPGNSGGPLLAQDGRVYGVVFAASTSEKGIGYALTAAEIAKDVQVGKAASTPVSTEACQQS